MAGVAAPVASKILSEALPYLNIEQDNLNEEETRASIEVPNIVGSTYKEAEKILKDAGLTITMRNKETEISGEQIITKQVPEAGIQILCGGSVIVE